MKNLLLSLALVGMVAGWAGAASTETIRVNGATVAVETSEYVWVYVYADKVPQSPLWKLESTEVLLVVDNLECYQKYRKVYYPVEWGMCVERGGEVIFSSPSWQHPPAPCTKQIGFKPDHSVVWRNPNEN